MEKIEVDVQPKPFEILSVYKTNYRSGKRYEVTVRLCWGVAPVATKFQCYTATIAVPFDREHEAPADLKAKVKARLDELKAADHSEANLIFNLMHVSLAG